jgi:hypothetical protein
MNDIIVIDDVIDIEQQKAIEDLCVSENFGWIFHQTSAYNKRSTTALPLDFYNNSVESPLFVHTLWNEWGRNSNMFSYFVPILDALPFEISNLLRVKVNLTLPVEGSTANTHSVPHVDYANITDSYITAIYYVNDSDGDTVIFNEQNGHQGPLTVKQRITPKRGRVVIFDGALFHSGNNPSTNNPRINLNINCITND